MKSKLIHEEFKAATHYNPETGIFIYTKDVINLFGGIHKKPGDIIGQLSKKGYWVMTFNGIARHRAQFAWFWMEGYWPDGYFVDHKNRIRHDDRWDNLRLVTHQCNTRNCNLAKNNKSGITGVYWFKQRGKWYAQIRVGDKNRSLGQFDSKIDAAMARWEGEKDNNYPDCNTSSYAYLYLKEKNAI